MSNLKMKRVLIALTFTMAMAGSSMMFAACDSKDTDETKSSTTTTTTEEESEGETEEETEAVSISSERVQAKADEFKDQGIDIEQIDASFLMADESIFVEGFRAIDADGNEYVCAQFTDPDLAYDLFHDVWIPQFDTYYVSNSNHKTMFGFHDNQLEGTVDGDGFMEYTVLDGTTESLPHVEAEAEPEIVYEDSGVQVYYEQSIYDGMTVIDKSYTIANAGEGFEATKLDSDGNLETTYCYKFENTDDAVDYVYSLAEETAYELEDDGTGTYISLLDADNNYEIEFMVCPDGLLIGFGEYE